MSESMGIQLPCTSLPYGENWCGPMGPGHRAGRPQEAKVPHQLEQRGAGCHQPSAACQTQGLEQN